MPKSADIWLARSFKALSHPRRAAIFRLLAERPETGRGFVHLQTETGIRNTPLIHHLREMERCGLVRRRRKGATVAYSLSPGDFTRALEEASQLARFRSPAILTRAAGTA